MGSVVTIISIHFEQYSRQKCSMLVVQPWGVCKHYFSVVHTSSDINKYSSYTPSAKLLHILFSWLSIIEQEARIQKHHCNCQTTTCHRKLVLYVRRYSKRAIIWYSPSLLEDSSWQYTKQQSSKVTHWETLGSYVDMHSINQTIIVVTNIMLHLAMWL